MTPNLIRIGENTFYIDAPCKTGVYVYEKGKAALIDGGTDESDGISVAETLGRNGLEPTVLFNTHFHADHTGGNSFLQKKFGLKIYLSPTEFHVLNSPLLNASLLYGATPPKKFLSKYYLSEKCNAESIENATLPQGFRFTSLAGHSPEMFGYGTKDGIWFTGDAYLDEKTVNSGQLPFIYNVGAYLRSLEKLRSLDGCLFVSSHFAPETDIKKIAGINEEYVDGLIGQVLSILSEAQTFDLILKKLLDRRSLKMSYNQMMLAGCTLRAVLSYLQDEDKIKITFADNSALWSV